ncbi:hypothetical protein FJ977_01785 [Mesorhizobium sp. B2-1-3A]|nr:hypothetical protein FJ977_01785 [Mesorhizobium sp. B2-1-3A]
MVKNIAFAAFLVQIAVVSGLITQTLLFASSPTQAASPQQLVVTPVAPVATDEECSKATWPDIPEHCLVRVDARKQVTVLVQSTAK